MAKRGYKLQEFVAHSANVNCLTIGKKGRLFITGGDDHKVNLWTIGKPTSLMSLSGHTNPIESLAFDTAEVLVLAGASTGVIKLWDVGESKMVRTLTGHRSNSTAVEFHPFGEFFASGSRDTNLKIWDIRKKGCIHTYKGHTQGISTIRFTPDGRWVVSGGLDNVVKIWDLTAGKLLHDFKFHEGPIRSIDFHPLEFLLATGSADKTVKFWDLETFELIGSARREATGVRSIAFHPDGRTLVAGLEDCMKVYSWEPVICHDVVDMGWTTLGDLCIREGKLLACSYYQNSVGVWVADIMKVEQYGADLESKKNEVREQKFDVQGNHPWEVTIGIRSTGLWSVSPDNEMKDIKNIYVDSSSGRPAVSKRSGPFNPVEEKSKVIPKQNCSLESPTKTPANVARVNSNEQTVEKSFVVPNIVPRDIPDGKDSAKTGKETISFSRTKPGMLLRPAHVRRASTGKYDIEKLLIEPEAKTISVVTCNIDSPKDPTVHFRYGSRGAPKGKYGVERMLIEPEAKTIGDVTCNIDSPKDPIVHVRPGSRDAPKEIFEDKDTEIKTVTNKSEKTLPPQSSPDEDKCKFGNKSPSHDDRSSVRYVNGVAVVQGRTRSLVERFERRESIQSNEDQSCLLPAMTPETEKSPSILRGESQNMRRDSNSGDEVDDTEDLMQTHDVLLSALRSRLTKLQIVRHFWERNDIKGAINALRKLPDQSVQADVISLLMEKMDVLTLDLFSCLLPVLSDLLDGKIERHVSVSLEMLVKLVAVFGPVINSMVSATPVVGVDLHAEERLECCKQCFSQLQKIQKILPMLIRRGGLLAKFAMELNLVLQQS